MAERPIGCCGVCPPIVGGGYDCTCAGNPRCPKRKPQRIQRKRTKGYRMPAGAIYVGRPTKWGNPFRPIYRDGQWWVVDNNDVTYQPDFNSEPSAFRKAVNLYYADVVGELAPYPPLENLRGRDLVCWCPPDQPCHADVLLEIANS